MLREALPTGITLRRAALPDVPELALLLLDPACLDAPLSGERASAAHTTPPYWALAWASGQVVARHILDHPERVRDKRVIDFGTGSGIVALAAALAGAREVIAIDRDPLSLEATRQNAEAMGVTLTPATELTEHADVLCAADVLYDRDNAHLLDLFRAHAKTVLVAESRFPELPHPSYVEIAAQTSCTYPDIDESQNLKHVRIFASERA